MIDSALHFVIPTYRLRDVAETVLAYDDNFWRNGQTAPIIVFDDSSVANHEKYYAQLENAKTHNELFYVGPAEKEQFISYICRRLRSKKLDVLVRNLFRPSYGGNRNFTLMYTLGDHLVSADADMRPYALIEDSPEPLGENEISRGKLLPRGANGHTRKSYGSNGSRMAHSASVKSLGKSRSPLANCRRVVSVHMCHSVVVSQ